MKCDTNTMLKTAAGLAVVAGVIYFTVPAAQAFVLASAPILIALICPISMLIMMKMMNTKGAEGYGTANEAGKPAQLQERAPAVAMEASSEPTPAVQPGGNSPSRQVNSAGYGDAIRADSYAGHADTGSIAPRHT